ncbi:MAG: hypothetical protein ACKV19_18840 [Verrucomicrobiales bacterium]
MIPRFPVTRAIGAALLALAMTLPALSGPLSVTWGAQAAGGALATADGRELPPGCLVRLGFFDLPLARVQETAWDPVFLDEHFTEIARSAIGQFAGAALDVSGGCAHTFPVDSLRLTSQISNRPLCVWAFNAASPAEATETGIFTSPSWNIRLSQVGSLIWDLSQIDPSGLVVGALSPTQSPTLGGQMNQLARIYHLWDQSDVDRDGVTSLLEDAFGMNPEAPDAGLLPALIVLDEEWTQGPQPTEGTQGTLGYQFRCVSGGTQVSAVVYETTDFRYLVEVSNDLRNWRVDPAACQLHNRYPAAPGFDVLTLRPTPSLSSTPDFYRLKVERRGDG